MEECAGLLLEDIHHSPLDAGPQIVSGDFELNLLASLRKHLLKLLVDLRGEEIYLLFFWKHLLELRVDLRGEEIYLQKTYHKGFIGFFLVDHLGDEMIIYLPRTYHKGFVEFVF